MSEKSFELPLVPRSRKRVNPRNLIVFSKPKVGKTSTFVKFPNSLLIDLEKGSHFVEGLIIEPENYEELVMYAKKIKEREQPFDFIIVDTITKLEDMCIPYAEVLYSQTLLGKSWFQKGKKEYGHILNLPNGAGYSYLRTAFTRMITMLEGLGNNLILLGHVKDKVIDKSGAEFSAMDLDLTGKDGRIAAANSDSIGYMYRKNAVQNYISFMTSDAVVCGSRSPHLSNKEILISELKNPGTDQEELVVYWDNLYV